MKPDALTVLQAGVDTALLHLGEAEGEVENISPILLASPITAETADVASSHAERGLAALEDLRKDLNILAQMLSRVRKAGP